MIENQFQLENTRVKLQRLEELCEQTKQRKASRARDASLRSLKRMINQFKEEIAVFEAHQRAGVTKDL